MNKVRIFSYLPNPRVHKATIASRLNGVEVELRGARPAELKDWLWDFDAHPLTDTERENTATLRTAKKGFSGGIHKTDAFLAAHPYGTVPAAFSGDGSVGVFESNSILRLVARLGEEQCALYGQNALEATRIDSFLDASLNFAIESQKYLFSFSDNQSLKLAHPLMSEAFEVYMKGIERALDAGTYIVGDSISIADIAYVCELTLFSLERHEGERFKALGLDSIFETGAADCPRAKAHFSQLMGHAAFGPDLRDYYNEMTMRKAFT